MQNLNLTYSDKLMVIIEELNASELLQTYLDSEEDSDYKVLQETFEPKIEELHIDVATNAPLQLIALEELILDNKLEGLFLPRILGYAVVRGEVNESFKYARPQKHFEHILLKIGNSANFDYIKKRTGQTIQIGFSMSSDIWVTNLINRIKNKRVRYYFENLISIRLRDVVARKSSYFKYKKQFGHMIFQTVVFPDTISDLKLYYNKLNDFLKYRVLNGLDHTSYLIELKTFIQKKEFKTEKEYIKALYIIANYLEYDDSFAKLLSDIFNDSRENTPKFNELYFSFHQDALMDGVEQLTTMDMRISNILDKTTQDELSRYYNMMDILHTKGFLHEETIDAVKSFYSNHDGLSIINSCLRLSILNYLKFMMIKLQPQDYLDYFETNKIFNLYVDIFYNEKFNQSLKKLSLTYIKKLLKFYTDKRGKDYQDIKKFVTSNFLEMGFMNEKQLKELFKTRRKKKLVS